MKPNPAGEPVILHSCHNLCGNDFTGPTLAVAACDPTDGRQHWAVNDLMSSGGRQYSLRQLGSGGLCAGCGDHPAESCANTAPGSLGANYGPSPWPENYRDGLGLGMQACINGDRQAW